LNNIYWSYAPVASDALKRVQAQVPTVETSDFFDFHTVDAMRLPHPLSKWEPAFKDCQTWVKSSLVLVIASILEVYIRTAVALALESDPGLLLGRSGLIDGAKLMKGNPTYSYLSHGEKCVSGDWRTRIAMYQSYFGKVPKDLGDSVKDLEQLRNFRNGVGHTFGRNAREYRSRLDVRPKPLTNVSENRLKKWLSLVEKVVKAIDEHLGPEHIGAYECIYFFHSKIKLLPPTGHTTPATTLKKELNLLHGHAPGIDFCKDLIKYYDKL